MDANRSQTSHQPPLRAVILTALAVEYMAVRRHLSDLKEEIHPRGTIYERGTFWAKGQRWEVSLVEIGPGNPQAALEAERAIGHLEPSVLFFVGVAGGIKDVRLGDVVAANKIMSYEFGKAEKTFRSRADGGLLSYHLVQRARAKGRKNDWLQRLGDSAPNRTPRVFVGPIAAGEKVVGSTESPIWERLRATYGDVLAVEMEGYGVLRAANASSDVKALVIRGISDLIEGKSEADAAGWQEIASHHASAFAFEVLAKWTPASRLAPIPTPSTQRSDMTPQRLPSKALTFTERAKLVQYLLAIPHMANREQRGTVLAQLRAEISTNIKHNPTDKTHIFNVVNTCLGYPRGMQELRDVLQFFESDSIPMQRFEQVLNRLLAG
ncbi:MAG: effector-associated domain 2-containing protein [Ardenticatenaceae bacterium]